MKKLLSVSAMGLVLLAGCGSTGTTSYYGESAPSTSEGHEGEISTVSYDKSGDDITNVQFDVILPEGDTTSKMELSKNGDYGMKEKTGKGWYEHVEELDTYVNDNDAFPEVQTEGDNAGKAVDGTTTATIHIDGFQDAFNNAKEGTAPEAGSEA